MKKTVNQKIYVELLFYIYIYIKSHSPERLIFTAKKIFAVYK